MSLIRLSVWSWLMNSLRTTAYHIVCQVFKATRFFYELKTVLKLFLTIFQKTKILKRLCLQDITAHYSLMGRLDLESPTLW